MVVLVVMELMMVMVVLVIARRPVVHAARQIRQGVAVEGPAAVVVGGRRILSLGTGRILARAAGAWRGRSVARHRHPLVIGVVLFGRLNQVAKQVVVRELGVVDEALQVQGNLLSGQLGQLRVCLLGVRLFNDRRRGGVGGGDAGGTRRHFSRLQGGHSAGGGLMITPRHGSTASPSQQHSTA